MHDERFDKLAKLLVAYSIRLKRNETVLIEAFDIPDEMTVALIRAARKAGGVPFAQVYHTRVNRALALEASDTQLNLVVSHELARMKKMNAYIAVRGSHNMASGSMIRQLPMEPVDKLSKTRSINSPDARTRSQKERAVGKPCNKQFPSRTSSTIWTAAHSRWRIRQSGQISEFRSARWDCYSQPSPGATRWSNSRLAVWWTARDRARSSMC